MQHPERNECHSPQESPDIVIQIDRRRFPCHRVVLAAASNYFDAMFHGGPYQEDTSKVIPLDPAIISESTFLAVRALMYHSSGTVPITMENICPLLTAADYLELKPEVEKVITDFIEKNLPNEHMFEVVRFAKRTGRHSLLYHIADYISCHLDQYSKTSDFLESHLEVIKMIIDLSTMEEEIVINATIEWINHKREERWQYFSQLSRLGIMMAVVAPTKIESMARSLIPDGTSDKDMASYLEDLKRTNIDETLQVYWTCSDTSRRDIFEVSIHHAVNCNILQTKDHCGGMKKVIWDRSIFYSLNYIGLYNMEDGFGCIEFRSYTLDGEILKTLMPPMETTKEKPIYYNDFIADFHLSGLPNIKQIYLHNANERSLHVYHCDTDTWNEIKPEKKGRWATMATCETSNTVYLVGGETGDAYLQAYDCCAEKWTYNLPKPNRRYSGRAVMCVFNGKLYLYHRSDRVYDIYDPSKNEWHTSKSNPHILAECPQRVVAYGDELWLFACARYVNSKSACAAYLYRPKSNSWRKYSLMRTAMEGKGVSFDLNAKEPSFLDAVVY